MNPDRVVLGSTNREAAERVAELYYPLHAGTIVTDLRTAEMIKDPSNAFLAIKTSFINEMANICEVRGADIKDVARGMRTDQRIGPQFLSRRLPRHATALRALLPTEGPHVRSALRSETE
jgi:UDPglucose 6-dehydrogenase